MWVAEKPDPPAKARRVKDRDGSPARNPAFEGVGRDPVLGQLADEPEIASHSADVAATDRDGGKNGGSSAELSEEGDGGQHVAWRLMACRLASCQLWVATSTLAVDGGVGGLPALRARQRIASG